MLLPVLLWGPQPPSFRTICVFLTKDDKQIVAGSAEGQLLVCDAFSKAIVPRCILVGHSAGVVAVDQLKNGQNNLHIASASSNGEVFKWNITDGSFIQSKTLQGPLTSLQVLPSSQNVLICGEYGAMTILDALSFDIRHILIPSDPTHWTLCYTIYQPPKTKDEEIVCMTLNGQVKTWNLQYDSTENMILESETKILSCPEPVCLTYNPRSLYNCLIVCESNWRIYRAGDFVLLSSDCSNQETSWAGGKFYSLDRVILWKEVGDFYVYQLPARAIMPVDHSDNSWTAEPSTCLYTFKTGPTDPCVVMYRQAMRPTHDIIIRGNPNGRLSMWHPDKDIVKRGGPGESVTTSLLDIWEDAPAGLLNDPCAKCGMALEITASVSLEPLSFIACGLASGDIVVSSIHNLMTQALFNTEGGGRERKRLLGHAGEVTVLLFPYTLQPTCYTPNILYSGGADFSVKIWEWEKEMLLQSFTVHSGPLYRLILPPTQAAGRLRGSVIAICQDNTVSISKGSQSTPLFVGSCHHTGILDIRWRLSEDILLVHCNDDTVYVWGLSTGHLDRIESGSIALNIITAATSTPSQGTDHHLKIVPPGATFPKHTTGLTVTPFKFSKNDSLSHILVFDTELLLHLLSHLQGDTMDDDIETEYKLPKNSSLNLESIRKKVVARAESRFSERRDSIIKHTETAKLLEERNVTLSLAPGVEESKTMSPTDEMAPGSPGSIRRNLMQNLAHRTDAIKQSCSLLLSCLHAWGVDLNIDRTCLKHLGLAAPRHRIQYGTVSSDSTFMLLLPQWEQRIEQQTPATIHAPYGRWCVSSTLTTQHLLSVSALANKQMSTDFTLSFNQQSRSVSLKRDEPEREELLRASINESEKKAGWSHVTALHCIVLPEHVPSGYRSPLLPQLALKWQDRCMEVREASQALFLRELRRLGFAGRQQLVNQYYPYIFRKRELIQPGPLEKVTCPELPAVPDYYKRYICTPTKSISSVSLRDEDTEPDAYAVSVIILGVLVAEFGDEVETSNTRSHVTSPDRRDAIRSSFLLTYDMLKMVAAHLFAQLTKPPNQLPLHSPIRRSAVDLIGRGFNVWVEFMNLTAVMMTLLELQTDPMVPIEIKKAIAQSGNIPGTGNKERLAAAATVRAAYQASILIASLRPQQTVNSLSKEITTFKCDMEAGLSIQSLSVFPSSFHAVLDKGRYPIYLLVQNIIEKTKSRDLATIIVKVVDIMLFCIDTEQFKTRTLGELVPSLTRNPLLDYCSTTQQVAVGSDEGLIQVFDVRSGKCTPLHAHNAPTSAVSWSTNGRTLVTFSEREGKVSIWQSSSGILSLMSAGPLKLLRTVDSMPPKKQGAFSKSPLFKWEAPKLISLYLNDGTKKSFAV